MRVLEVVRQLNYHPNGMARGLARRRADTLGVIFPCVEPGIVTNTYAFGILQGILTAADELGFNVTLLTESNEGSRSEAGIRDGRTDGLLVVAPHIDSVLTARIVALRIPVVGISVAWQYPGVPTVDVDNIEGARLATRHLLALGHTRIAHLTGDLNLVSGRDRCRGFLEALDEAGLVGRERPLIEGSYASLDRESNKANVRLALDRPGRPTAIFAANDSLAIAAGEAARDLGLEVPDDLSIVGFDDIPSAALVTPPLTSVRQPVSEIGREAARLLAARILGEAAPEGPLLLKPELVLRGSTAAARSLAGLSTSAVKAQPDFDARSTAVGAPAAKAAR